MTFPADWFCVLTLAALVWSRAIARPDYAARVIGRDVTAAAFGDYAVSHIPLRLVSAELVQSARLFSVSHHIFFARIPRIAASRHAKKYR